MTKVDLIYFNAGGGHRAASVALSTILAKTHPEWDVRCVNLTEVLENKITGTGFESFYNKIIQNGWTYGFKYGLRILQKAIKLNNKKLIKILSEHWQETQPDIVISLIPNFNRPLFEGLKLSCPNVPYVTILTDIADNPPNFWIEEQKQYFICGSEKAVTQSYSLGHTSSNVFLVSGMMLRPDFYNTITGVPALPLDTNRPIGMVMFGGKGSDDMLTIAKKLPNIQLIFICGHNPGLKEKLEKIKTSNHVVIGFATDVNRYMSVCDFFIGKPGPGSLSEAVQMKLPVITFRNRLTMPQEIYNTEWVKKYNLGEIIESLKYINLAVDAVLSKEYNKSINNRAIFEIPTILENILKNHRPGQS